MHNVVNTGANICNYLFLRYKILPLQKHCSAHRTVYTEQCTPHSVHCIVYSVVIKTVNIIPCTCANCIMPCHTHYTCVGVPFSFLSFK